MKRVILLMALVLSGLLCVSAVAAMDSLAGDLLVATHDYTTGEQTFWTVDPVTGAKVQHGTAAIGDRNDGMGFSGGKLYVAQDQDFRVMEVDFMSGAFSVIAERGVNVDSFGNIKDMTIAADGGLWVLGGSIVSRIDPVTGDQDPIYEDMWNGPGGIYNSWGMTTEASGMMLRSFLSHIGDGDSGISRLDPATGIETLLISGMDNPNSITVADDGSIYVDEQQGYGSRYRGIHRIDPVTGEETVISTDPRIGDWNSDLMWISGHGLYKIDTYTDSILRIDVATGGVSTLTTFSGDLGPRTAVVPVPEATAICVLMLGALSLMRRSYT